MFVTLLTETRIDRKPIYRGLPDSITRNMLHCLVLRLVLIRRLLQAGKIIKIFNIKCVDMVLSLCSKFHVPSCDVSLISYNSNLNTYIFARPTY
jgi:hypothetical protein